MARAKRNAARTGCIVVVALLVSGCDYTRSIMRPDDLVDRAKETGQAASDEQIKPIDLRTYRFPDTPSDGDLAYKLANNKPADRNRLQDILIRRSDVACQEFQDDMYARIVARKASFKTVALLTSAAAAIVDGQTVSRILAGTAASATGVDSILDAEILQNQLATIVISQIRTRRGEIIQTIESRREGARTDTDSYTVDAAIRDAVDYHSACAFLPAIVALGAKAQEPSFDIGTAIQRVQRRIKEEREELAQLRSAGANNDTIAIQQQLLQTLTQQRLSLEVLQQR